MSLIKVAWYVLWVKTMHPESSSDLSGTATAKAKPRYVYSILEPHGQSFRKQVRLLLSEGKLNYVCSILRLHCQSSRSPVRLLLSEGKAELHILDSWSDFQNTIATKWSEAELRLYNLKETSPPQSRSQAVVCVSTPRMYT